MSDVRAGSEAPVDPFRWWRWLAPLFSVVVFALVAWILHHVLSGYHLRDVFAALKAIPRSAVLAACALTFASYCMLTLYDWLGVEYVQKPVSYPRTALTSFIAYAFGNNLSLAAFTGGAVRYRLYSAQGLTAVDVATIVSMCALTTAIGISMLAGTALLVAAPGGGALHVGHFWSKLIGALLVAWVAGYVLWAGLARAPLAIGPWALRPPGARLAIAQVLVAVVDLTLASGVLYVLLPAAATTGFVTFTGLYAVAVVAGILSQVPGGLGVIEALISLALPAVPAPQLLGALLAYRGIYYLAPLLIAALAFVAHEFYRQRPRLVRAGGFAGSVLGPLLTPVAPQLIGVLVFLAGAVLLVSGATPAVDARIGKLVDIVPLPLLELSHLAGSVIGVGLLVLARGLFRRLAAAYQLTFWLLVAGIAASVLKGLDVEEAAYLGLVLLVMWLARRAFHRPSTIMSQRFTPGWIASVAIMVALSVWIGVLAHRHVPYSHDLWWTFALKGDAPRMLRASFAVVVAVAAFMAVNLMKPAPPEPHDPAQLDLDRARVAIARSDSSLANAALAGDKRLLFHPAGDAFVMYQVSGASWVALGDPVGAPERDEELVWAFRELVDRRGGRTVFYEVSDRALPLYIDLGLSLLKLGEEAKVALADFHLEGSARADLRHARRRAQRDGARFEVVAKAGVPPLLPRLKAISDAWLDDRVTAEKGFSLGAFSERYLSEFPVAIVKSEGDIVAFANLWGTEACEELSVDLMRFLPDAPRSSMDFLFIELMLWGRAQGYRTFNLGMAPLAGLENRALAPLWHRLGSFLYRHGESFYNFEGLRRFKSKFDPVWEPRYLASPGGLHLPRVLLDVSSLIAGGIKELIVK
ncbi:MAG TPA: bifunctional lysylphosphatidylglycerol flippase/synthetase MprF [Steroidobacteraceae bacterium]|nr:bifunctional lysylphosphatidylglycerol flippase/synthetase MprF [Steroidobacteraceae bacterium]